MEVLTKVAFSLDAENQSELNKNLVSLSSGFVQPPYWIDLIAAMPLGRYIVKYIPAAHKNQLKPLLELAIKLVQGRRKDTQVSKKKVLVFF